jgi:hypothetical protein
MGTQPRKKVPEIPFIRRSPSKVKDDELLGTVSWMPCTYQSITSFFSFSSVQKVNRRVLEATKQRKKFAHTVY